MTQLPCQVLVLTPETGRFKPSRALPDPAEPGLLPASCRRPRGRPVPPTVRDGAWKPDPTGGGKEGCHRGPGRHMMNHRADRPGGTPVTCAFDPARDQDRSGRTA